MDAMTLLPHAGPFTRSDLDAAPDDGRRYELIDGALIVTPAPGHLHQRAVGELHLALRAGCPDDLEVLLGPFDVVLADDTVMQPDLLVARRADVTARDLPAAPLLAVEVVSPSTRRLDLTLKRARLEAAGCASYWVVDPLEPSLTVWQLEGSTYAERARVTGGTTWRTTAPYAVEVAPAALVA